MSVCLRCGRHITSARSKRLGYGEECWRKMRALVAAIREAVDTTPHEFTERQIESAVELIEDRGIVHINNYVFEAVSTDGTTTYLTAPDECMCPAGEAERACYHMLASIIFMGLDAT
jgi:hypothetical protein